MINDKIEIQSSGETGQEARKDMEHHDLFSPLEKKFQDAFIGEIIPGIVHNFANPLNGIMGRSKLLQRKLAELMKNLDSERTVSNLEGHEKLVNDVESIAREADRLSTMLQCVTGKFCTVSDKTVQRIQVSDLIEIEMKFFDFYLEFKHTIKKYIHLEREVPLVQGVPADYSLALSALILHSMEISKESSAKEFHISTQFENGQVCIKIQNSGEPISDDLKKHVLRDLQEGTPSFDDRYGGEVWYAFALLKKWGARFEIGSDSQLNTIAVFIPPYEA